MIRGIGTDIVAVERIAAALARTGDRFIARVLHPDERALMPDGANQAAWLAKRWAAKEAAAKALGTGIGAHAALTDFAVMKTAAGAPFLVVTGAAAESAGAGACWHLSLSDDAGMALAYVVLTD